jgi:zinc D-Ala-D-Ala dipeptidase
MHKSNIKRDEDRAMPCLYGKNENMKYIFYALLIFIVACTNTRQPNTPETKSFSQKNLKDSLPTPKILPKKIDYDTAQWTDIGIAAPTIRLDMRYATDNNFVKTQMYPCGRCLLRPEVAKALIKAHQKLQKQQLGLKMFDCFRPRPIQQKLWDKVPDARFVTPPAKGSMHNRGAAVDLTIVDKSGKELNMGTEFDFFGKEAYHDYLEHPKNILKNRDLLKNTMKSVGFDSIRTEWWHYAYYKGKYELSDFVWKCEN